MDRQQIFDTVADGLIAQGRKSTRKVSNGLALAYRGDDGRKCAAGFLIPDLMYRREEMEGHLFNDHAFDAVRRAQGIMPEDGTLIVQLQWIHDSCEPTSWREELAALGHRFQLDIFNIWPRSSPAPTSRIMRKD